MGLDTTHTVSSITRIVKERSGGKTVKRLLHV